MQKCKTAAASDVSGRRKNARRNLFTFVRPGSKDKEAGQSCQHDQAEWSRALLWAQARHAALPRFHTCGSVKWTRCLGPPHPRTSIRAVACPFIMQSTRRGSLWARGKQCNALQWRCGVCRARAAWAALMAAAAAPQVEASCVGQRGFTVQTEPSRAAVRAMGGQTAFNTRQKAKCEMRDAGCANVLSGRKVEKESGRVHSHSMHRSFQLRADAEWGSPPSLPTLAILALPRSGYRWLPHSHHHPIDLHSSS